MTLNPNDPLNQLASELLQKARDPDLDGYKPLPHQIAYHQDRTKGRIAFGGNRSGKSYSSVCEMVWWATGTHPYRATPRPPLALRHVAVDKPQGIDKVLKELYRKLVPKRYLRGGSFDKAWETQPPMLHFSNNSFIEFLSYEQDLDKHAGTSRHAIAFDEEPDEAIFNENMARLIDTDGDWWIAMTPLEGLSWMYTRFQLPFEEGELGENVNIHKFKSRDNYYLKAGAIDRLLEGLSAEERQARLVGDFMALSGLIFPFDIKTHVVDMEAQPNLLTFCGMDHGLRNPTAWLWIQTDQDGTYYVMKEHYESGLVVAEHANAVKLVEAGNPKLRPEYRVGDPSIVNRNPISGQSVHTEYAAYGINIGLGNNDVNAGLNRLAQLFSFDSDTEPKIFVNSECRHLIKELRTYRWDEWASRKMQTAKEAKNAPKKKDDHAVDALRYAIMSRPLFDGGNGPLVQTPPPEPGVLYATSVGSSRSEFLDDRWHVGQSYGDSELGAEW